MRDTEENNKETDKVSSSREERRVLSSSREERRRPSKDQHGNLIGYGSQALELRTPDRSNKKNKIPKPL